MINSNILNCLHVGMSTRDPPLNHVCKTIIKKNTFSFVKPQAPRVSLKTVGNPTLIMRGSMTKYLLQ